MAINHLLAFDLEYAEKELIRNDYNIIEISYLNEPPGEIRVVRITEVSPKNVKILVSYQKDALTTSS